jgi:hypothetical protein
LDNSETSEGQRALGADVIPLRRNPQLPPPQITFDRRELGQIFNIYGRMVAAGEWRDYALDFLRDRAVFSIFRRAAETPLYTVVKDPSLARKQGMYAVVTGEGHVLKRGQELDRVLAVLAAKVKLEVVR